VAKTKKFALDSKNQRLVQFDNILPMLILALREAGSATNIIDFGGAAGAHYFTAKNYLGIDAKIKWKIIETPNMRHRASRAISSETQLIFERSLNDAVIADEDNLVIANFSVCYIEDPYAILRQMLELGCRKILLMQTPFSIDELQKPVLFQKSRLKDHGVQSVKISKSNKKIFTPITILELPKLVERLKGVGRISFYAQQSKDIFFKNGSYDAYAILIEKCDK
jgi:putative methyltransferase (TIGR04325 family)